jgi:hypothetical protein
MNNNITYVTGLWDLGRGELDGWAKRDFNDYKIKFFELLEADVQMCIWIPSNLEKEVIEKRKGKKTQIFIKELEDFETWNPFFNEIDKIRNDINWYSKADWLKSSPQGGLKYYNPMMFTKMFMVNDSSIINPFNSEYFFWIDGGLTNTVSKEYFLNDKVLDNLENYIFEKSDKFLFLSFPYTSNDEIHGFDRKSIAEYCNTDFVDYVCRGGFFGGKKDKINLMNEYYYNILDTTIKNNLMGADESLFTILSYKYKDIIHRFEIEGNGLVWPFFEELKKYTINTKPKIGLYVLTYNSPKQFETLLKTFEIYDNNFLEKTKKYLINNSIDLTTQKEYDNLCEKYGFEQIKKDNIGICGGRQFIAEHSEEHGLDFHLFFEDDMFFYVGGDEFCKNGFRRKIENFFNLVIDIMNTEKFDFLKFNFSEFYGDHTQQWAWYNVPQDIREEYFPEKPIRTNNEKNAPLLNFNNIKSYRQLPYITGEIFYSNWPQIVSREGNRKMFLETKWDYPYEQTWMSHMFQETKNKKLYPGLLLATPTEHDRFEFYKAEERREN